MSSTIGGASAMCIVPETVPVSPRSSVTVKVTGKSPKTEGIPVTSPVVRLVRTKPSGRVVEDTMVLLFVMLIVGTAWPVKAVPRTSPVEGFKKRIVGSGAATTVNVSVAVAVSPEILSVTVKVIG